VAPGDFTANNPQQSAVTGNWVGAQGVGNWSADVAKYRLMYAGHTGVLNAASLTDQGMCVAAQGPSDIDSKTLVDTNLGPGAPIGGSGSAGTDTIAFISGNSYLLTQPYSYGSGTPLPTFDDILSMSPRAEQWRAKDGFYFPLRFVDGLFQWQDSTQLYVNAANPWTAASGAASTQWRVAFPLGPPPGRSLWGYACFRGLASTTTLSLTSRIGYECMVGQKSNFKAFLTESCEPDGSALDQYFAISNKLADVYPAIYNEEDLLSSVITGLSTALGFIPGPIGAIARIAGPAINGIRGIFSKKSASASPAQPRMQENPKASGFTRTLKRNLADDAMTATLAGNSPAGKVRKTMKQNQLTQQGRPKAIAVRKRQRK
jgi:hypothetical protein